MRRNRLSLLAAFVAAGAIALLAGLGTASADSSGGSFSPPFAEPGPNCVQDTPAFPMLPSNPDTVPCKPAAVSMAFLPGGQVLYWNGLEGMENIQLNTVAEDGNVATCDQARTLTINYSNPSGSSWTPAGNGLCSTTDSNYQSNYLIPGLPIDGTGSAPDALFCSSLILLANGDVLTTGGTDYYEEPNIPGTNFGVSELEGTKTTRVYDPKRGWLNVGSMNYGRWYPSLVTMPSGDLFVASGVTKLIKPVYPNAPTDSGTNVEETETFHIASAPYGRWTVNNPATANFTLPLFPRLHLLPDGKVWYDAGGQTFNPDGQSYDEVLWNFPAVYDPATQTWTRESTIPGIGTADPGFRGSGFSIQLPLKAPYTTASFLSGGGVAGVTPGTYLATNTSEINTVDTAKGDAWTNSPQGNLNHARWYSTAIVLPDESVMAFSGATADEVVGPGSAMPVKQAERFDPATGQWTPMATANDGRTYHNTAILLPTGQVLVGGHSPINFMYSREETLPGGFSNNYRDDSFELYNPPYMTAQRPSISYVSSQVLNYGRQFSVTTHQAHQVTKVLLVRNPAITHLVDADQRTVELPFTVGSGDSLHVQMPSNPAVLPPGPYYLFIDTGAGSSLVPSTAVQLFVEPTPRVVSPGGSATTTASRSVTVPAPTQSAARQATQAARKVHVALAAETSPLLPLPLIPIAAAAAFAVGCVTFRRARRARRT